MSTDGRTGGSRAAEDALSMLARRPLTEAELRERLVARRHPETAVLEACARLREAGYVDDGRLALDFIVLRAERLGHGPSKLIEALCRRGVDREVAETALRRAVDHGDLDIGGLLQRRLQRMLAQGAGGGGPRDRLRVYNALRRAGFDEEAIRREMASLPGSREPSPHEEDAEPDTDDIADDLS